MLQHRSILHADLRSRTQTVSKQMKDVFEYTIPVLHPLLVHFPVVLIPTSIVVCVLWVRSVDPSWDTSAPVFLAVCAFASTAAFLTGEALYAQSEGVPVVEQFVGRHEQLGRLVMIGTILTAVLAVVSRLIIQNQDRSSRWLRVGCLLLAVLNTLLVLATAHLGGIMVWGEYVGP